MFVQWMRILANSTLQVCFPASCQSTTEEVRQLTLLNCRNYERPFIRPKSNTETVLLLMADNPNSSHWQASKLRTRPCSAVLSLGDGLYHQHRPWPSWPAGYDSHCEQRSWKHTKTQTSAQNGSIGSLETTHPDVLQSVPAGLTTGNWSMVWSQLHFIFQTLVGQRDRGSMVLGVTW